MTTTNASTSELQKFTIFFMPRLDQGYGAQDTFVCEAASLADAGKMAKEAYPHALINYAVSYAEGDFAASKYAEQVDWDCESLSGFLLGAVTDDGEIANPEMGPYCVQVAEHRNRDLVDEHTFTNYEGARLWLAGEYLEHAQWRYTMRDLCALWNDLRDVPVNDEDELDEPFMFFPEGVHREDVWRWFEAVNPKFIVGEAGSYIGPGHPFLKA